MDRPASTERILLVEDNPQDVEIAERALKMHGLMSELIVARDGREALDLLFPPDEDNGSLPGLVLLDLDLPGVNGHEVLAKIKDSPRTRRIPVILLTTSGHEVDIVRGYNAGANSYIVKPFEFDDFVKVVASIGDYWLVTVALPPSEVSEVAPS